MSEYFRVQAVISKRSKRVLRDKALVCACLQTDDDKIYKEPM